MNDKYILNDYFDWLYFMVVPNGGKFRKLLTMLHTMEFKYFVEYDENRASDGVNLRWYYVDDGGDDEILRWKEPCTVLEMLIALAMHMDKIVGDRELDIVHWFWLMLDNLDLAWMKDDKYDKTYVYGRVAMFLDREYEPDGNGNIIYIPDSPDDLRDVEIWNQMCWYLDSIL